MFYLIDKPEHWTSHDVVAYLRGVLKEKKVGHAGTLDPFATGLLIVGVGRESTKQLDQFKALNKTYEATIHFGATSDTQDKTGTITKQDTDHIAQPSVEQICQVLSQFTGRLQQIPPMYSAKKIGGKKLYELARNGKEAAREPRDITITSAHLLSYEYPLATFEVTCSPGTYIRTLCHDIGQILGIGAYCEDLRRTKIGMYTVSLAVPPKQLDIATKKGMLQE